MRGFDMRFWLDIFLAAVLFLFVGVKLADAQEFTHLDLWNEKVTAVGECENFFKIYSCFAVKHEGKTYIIVIDKNGEAYQLEEKPDGTLEVVWARDTI